MSYSVAHRHTCVALKITEKLLSDCDQQRIQLIADSYLDMLHTMLESVDTELQVMATSSVSQYMYRNVLFWWIMIFTENVVIMSCIAFVLHNNSMQINENSANYEVPF